MKKHKIKTRLKTKIEQSKRRKRIWLKSTATFVLLFILGFVVNKTSKFLLTSPIFNVKSTEVRENDILPKSVILDYLDFDEKNIFSLKLKSTETQLKENFAVISDVEINRCLPNGIVVKIIERVPVAEIKVSDKRVGIDEHLVSFVLPDNYTLLPKISDDLTTENKTACLKFLKNVFHLSIYKEITGITSAAVDYIVFFIGDNCKICIGTPDNMEQKILYLGKVLSDLETKGEKAQYINMRDFSNEHREVVVMPKMEAVKNVKRKNNRWS